jgi:hypothetical protein
VTFGLALAALGAGLPSRAADAPPVQAPTPAPTTRPAGGIQTDFGDVQIDNLGIGRTYNLRDLAGTPLKVTNTGADTVNLVMSVQIPPEQMIMPFRREAGFKPIPTPDWVTLSQTQFIVPSGESAYSDVVINVPNDPALYGKKFQASIYSRTAGDGINVGVWSHLMMTIAPSPEAQKEIEQNRKRGTVGNMDYTLLPDKLAVPSASLGRAMDLKKELKRTIMLANSGETAIRLRVKSVPVGDTPLSLQTGYVAGNPEWLTVAQSEVTVDGAAFADPGLSLHLPKDPSLAGKKLMFVIRVAPADPEVVGVTFYGKLYVEVAP